MRNESVDDIRFANDGAHELLSLTSNAAIDFLNFDNFSILFRLLSLTSSAAINFLNFDNFSILIQSFHYPAHLHSLAHVVHTKDGSTFHQRHGV